MKKIVFALLLTFIFTCSLFSDDKDALLTVNVSVPENWGVNKPEEAVSIDHLVLEMNLSSESARLVNNTAFSLGSLDTLSDDLSIDFLYYGNLENDYVVRIKKEGITDFVSDKSPYSISFDTSFAPADFSDDNVSVSVVNNDEVLLKIAPEGPVNGKKVLKMNLDLEDAALLVPGTYSAQILLELESVK